MKTHCVLLLTLLLVISAGCSKRPEEVKKGDKLRTEAYVAASEGKSQIIDAILTKLQEAEYEKIDNRIEVEVQKQIDASRQFLPPDGKVNAEQAYAGFRKLMEFRDSERAKARAIVDAQIQRVRQIVNSTDGQLEIALRLDDEISKFDNAGVDLSGVRGAVEQILTIWKKKGPQSEAVPLN